MNQKASKQTLKWPPQLNLSENRPYIDTTFSNFEKINTPFMNEMLQPVWIKDTGSKAVYDTDGSRYEIIDGALYKDNIKLFNVSNKKFVKKDITSRLRHYHDYDLDDNYEAYTVWDDETNKFIITFNGNEYTTSKLFDYGVVVASRIRIIDRKAFFIVYFEDSDIGYINTYILNNDGNLITSDHQVIGVTWDRQTIRNAASNDGWGAKLGTTVTIQNADPIINIGKCYYNGEFTIYGVSLVSDYGKALNTTRNGFITYFIKLDDSDVSFWRLNLKNNTDAYSAHPFSSTASTEVTNTYNAGFRVVTQQVSGTVNGSCLSSDNGTTYYKYETEGVRGEQMDIPVTYTPTDTGNTVAISGTTYKIYNYSFVRYTYTINCACNDATVNYSFRAKDNNGNEYTSAASTDNKSLSFNVDLWRGETLGEHSFTNAYVTWLSEETEIPQDNWRSYYYLEREETTTVSAGWLCTPNIVLDSGLLYTMAGINQEYSTSGSWSASQILTNGCVLIESSLMSSWTESGTQATYTQMINEFVTANSAWGQIARVNSVVNMQNFFAHTMKMNNTSAVAPYGRSVSKTTESTVAKYMEYSNSNATDLRYMPGTTRDTTFNYFADTYYADDITSGDEEDFLPLQVQGYRVPVREAERYMFGSTASPFNILYNTTLSNTALPQGISYSESSETMGTLLTPWQSIDEDFYIAASHTKVVYRDKADRYYEISVEDGTELKALLDDRYILVNTTSYWNMWDSVLERPFHYATDYNGRTMFGQTTVPTAGMTAYDATGYVYYLRLCATAINASYRIMPRFGVMSELLPNVSRYRVGVGAEKPFRSDVDESDYNQPIDIYYGDIGGSSAKYRYSLYPYFANYLRTERYDLLDSTYQISSTTSEVLTPNIFTKFINGAGNNDMVQEDYSTYVLSYYDATPFFLYSASTEVSAKNNESINFFVIQGQFYSYMNDKIYSMIYSNGAVSSQDAIVDARGMVFCGNNTDIAIFWSPSQKSFYSFTGDASFAKLYSGSKFDEVC